MSGFDMMFKALGLDPEVIMKSAEDFKEGLANLNRDLAIIKAQQGAILEKLSHLENANNPLLSPSLESHINGVGHG